MHTHFRRTGITIVDGPLGSGKTMYGTADIEAALWRRRPVATNIELVGDWPERIAAQHLTMGRHLRRRRARVAEELSRFYFYSDDVMDVLFADIDADALGRPLQENEGLMVIDEAHSVLNNRLFNEEGRKEVVDRVRQLRKRAWECEVITQHVESVDKHVRDAATYRVELVNWARRYWWFPFDLFLALTWFHGDKKTSRTKPMDRSLYRRSNYICSLYDTMGLFGHERAPSTRRTRVLLPLASPVRAQLASTDGDAPGQRAGTVA